MQSFIIDDIHAITNEYEWWTMDMPPYAMFADNGIGTEEVAELLVELKKMYEFEVTDYPECLMDVVDMVEGRPFSRLSLQHNASESASAYDFTPISLSYKPKSLIRRIYEYLRKIW